MTNLVVIVKKDDGVFVNGKEIDFKIYFYLEKILLSKISYDQVNPYWGLIARDTVDNFPAIICPVEVLDMMKLGLEEIDEICKNVKKQMSDIWTNEKTITIKTKTLENSDEIVKTFRKSKKSK